MIKFSKELGDYKFFLGCASKASNFYQGGNFWSGWTSFLSFFRNVVNLTIDYSKWIHYEKLAELSSFRYLHKEFCIVCDRPSKLMVDDQNRPHCEDGPFCEWRDGSALYAYHGVRTPMWIIETPEKIKIQDIQNEKNVEIQRVMIEKYGVSEYLMDIKAEILDMDTLTLVGSAPRALMRDKNGKQWLIGSDGSSKRVYHMAINEGINTCKEAHNLLAGFDETRILAEC